MFVKGIYLVVPAIYLNAWGIVRGNYIQTQNLRFKKSTAQITNMKSNSNPPLNILLIPYTPKVNKRPQDSVS